MLGIGRGLGKVSVVDFGDEPIGPLGDDVRDRLMAGEEYEAVFF